MPTDRIEVQRNIPADAAAIFAIISDPLGHVAIDASGMLLDATGDPAKAVGDTFVVHMDREALNDIPDMGKYDILVTITNFAQDSEIEWRVQLHPNGVKADHRYGYTLQPVDGGTLVTTYCDWSQVAPERKHRYPIVPESALRATLGILTRTVARSSTR